MSQSKPRARKSAQRDAEPSGKRFDDAIGLLWLTPTGRGHLPPLVQVGDMLLACRKTLQTMEVCGDFAPAIGARRLASMRHPN
ncbi:MAG: hypothetical protein WC807_02525 [Hyphomicrobium sp.]|jgi:hypothetical protein